MASRLHDQPGRHALVNLVGHECFPSDFVGKSQPVDSYSHQLGNVLQMLVDVVDNRYAGSLLATVLVNDVLSPEKLIVDKRDVAFIERLGPGDNDQPVLFPVWWPSGYWSLASLFKLLWC